MSEKAAHVISERQKKGALSTIKKKPKLPKNVLMKNQIEFWPCLDDEKQSDEFTQILDDFSSDPENIKQLCIGLESSLRLIKKKEVKLLVIADEMSPRWFAQQLIAMTLHKSPKTKIVVVKNLKEITKNSLKVPSIIFGAKTSAFDKFYDQQVGTHSELLRNFCTIQPSIDVSIKKKRKQPTIAENPVVLLKKTSNSMRAFVPMDVDQSPESPPNIAQDTSGFISFSKLNDTLSNLSTNSPQPLYRPIKIKKVVGNSNRKQKKS